MDPLKKAIFPATVLGCLITILIVPALRWGLRVDIPLNPATYAIIGLGTVGEIGVGLIWEKIL